MNKNFRETLKQQLLEPEFKAEWDKLKSDEDKYDLLCYAQAVKEYRKNPKTYTHEEVAKELGLEEVCKTGAH